MKKKIKIVYILVMIFLTGMGIVHAQDEEITLKLSRDFGYSGAGKIQGLFSMKVTSSVQLSEVDFFIDDESIGKDAQEPFSIQFNTDNYSPGEHKLYAIGFTLDGKSLKTREEFAFFITSEESKKAAFSLILPILGLSLIAVIISAVIPGFTSKKGGNRAPGTEIKYGVAGGTICTRCNRPFSRHFLSPNMVLGKLERCPHCGKWGIFRAYPMDVLRTAERAELNSNEPALETKNPENDEEMSRQEIDSTKYQDD